MKRKQFVTFFFINFNFKCNFNLFSNYLSFFYYSLLTLQQYTKFLCFVHFLYYSLRERKKCTEISDKFSKVLTVVWEGYYINNNKNLSFFFVRSWNLITLRICRPVFCVVFPNFFFIFFSSIFYVYKDSDWVRV